jgi:glycosyltransferase involved in cell wall biosynthesis
MIKLKNEIKQNSPIAIFFETLGAGGIEQTCLKLTKGLHFSGIRVDLLLRSLEGEFVSLLPKEINTVNFSASRVLTTIFPLARYLRKEKPAVIISNGSAINIATLMARVLVRNCKTRLIITERTNIFRKRKYNFKARITLFCMRWLYPKADVVVGVSDGVSRALEERLGLENGSVKTIYNGIIDEGFYERANEPLEHEWFKPGSPPVLLAVGRLVEQKDFATLLRAFALLRKNRSAKLIILGEGRLRTLLEKQVDELELRDDVQMPGFEINPLKYYKNCSAFVLSSRFEGLGGVIIEALGCGCPVVATDCPSGPAEILENGEYGLLVPVGDPYALAEAMGKALDNPPEPGLLMDRAKEFSVEKAVSNYLSKI